MTPPYLAVTEFIVLIYSSYIPPQIETAVTTTTA